MVSGAHRPRRGSPLEIGQLPRSTAILVAMLRMLLPLGALTLAACHLVVGLDEYRTRPGPAGGPGGGAATTSNSSANGGAGGGAGGGANGGAGGDGGGATGPVIWASTFENADAKAGPVVGLGDDFLVLGAAFEKTAAFSFLGDEHKFAAAYDGPSAYAAVLGATKTATPKVSGEAWSKSLGATSTPIAAVASRDGKKGYVATLEATGGESQLRLREFTSGKPASEPLLLAKALTAVSMRGLQLALSPNGKSVYVGFTFEQGSVTYGLDLPTYKFAYAPMRSSILVLKCDTHADTPPTYAWGYGSDLAASSNGSGDELHGLAATDQRVVLATQIGSNYAGFGLTMQVFTSTKALALISIGTVNGEAAYDKPTDSRVLQCPSGTPMGLEVRPVAMAPSAANDTDVLVAFRSTCAFKDTYSAGPMPSIDHKAIAAGTFGIASIAGASLTGKFSSYISLDTGHDSNDVGGTLTTLARGPKATVLVGGQHVAGVWELAGTTRKPMPAVPGTGTTRRGFIVPIKAAFAGLGAGISTTGMGSASVRSLSFYNGFLAFGGTTAGGAVTLLNAQLTSNGPAQFIAVATQDAIPQ